MTQLLVINTGKMEVIAFDGRTQIDRATISVDKETTSEGLKEVLEDFRLSSSIVLRDLSDKDEQRTKILHERFQYADKEVASWL